MKIFFLYLLLATLSPHIQAQSTNLEDLEEKIHSLGVYVLNQWDGESDGAKRAYLRDFFEDVDRLRGRGLTDLEVENFLTSTFLSQEAREELFNHPCVLFIYPIGVILEEEEQVSKEMLERWEALKDIMGNSTNYENRLEELIREADEEQQCGSIVLPFGMYIFKHLNRAAKMKIVSETIKHTGFNLDYDQDFIALKQMDAIPKDGAIRAGVAVFARFYGGIFSLVMWRRMHSTPLFR